MFSYPACVSSSHQRLFCKKKVSPPQEYPKPPQLKDMSVRYHIESMMANWQEAVLIVEGCTTAQAVSGRVISYFQYYLC